MIRKTEIMIFDLLPPDSITRSLSTLWQIFNSYNLIGSIAHFLKSEGNLPPLWSYFQNQKDKLWKN